MKKLAIYLLAGTVLMAGCKKEFDDTINGQTPDQRIAAALTAYQDKLVKAPYGWIMLETTTGTAFNQGVSENGPVATFAYYMEFAANNKVSMFSDFDTSMAAVPKVSDFRVKALQRPALIFDTYSYLHVPCDPDPRVSKSPFGVGYGWGTDFEFSFADNVDVQKLQDTIRLTGNLNFANAVLIKATKAQHDAYFAGNLKTTMLAWGSIQNYFKRVTSGATQFELTPGLGGDKSVDINWLDNGVLKSANSSLYFLGNSVNLVKPATIGTQTVSRFENLVFDAGTSTITASINGNTAATIAGSTSPLKNDPNAPAAWYNKAVNAGVYWVTETNFHVNGKDDAYNVASIPAYAGFSIFYPKFGVSGGINYDLFSPIVVVNGGVNIVYGYAYRPPVFTAAGTVIFPPLGTLGTVPPAASTPFVSTRSKIAEATGYYLVLKEDNLTYDMVNVADAKAWIRWQWVF